MNINIRKAKLKDLSKIQIIARHTIDKNYREFLGDAGVDWFISGPSDEYLAENLPHTKVMLVDGSITGFAV